MTRHSGALASLATACALCGEPERGLPRLGQVERLWWYEGAVLVDHVASSGDEGTLVGLSPALSGRLHDGHDYLAAALSAGWRRIGTSPPPEAQIVAPLAPEVTGKLPRQVAALLASGAWRGVMPPSLEEHATPGPVRATSGTGRGTSGAALAARGAAGVEGRG